MCKEPFALGNENIKEAIARIPTHPEHGIEWLHPIPPRGTLLYTHPAPSQWISVEDRLPDFVTINNYEKSSDDILILIDGKHVYVGAYIFDNWSKTDDFCMRDLDGGYEVVSDMKVTNWMPLPEAPKE